MIKLFQKRFFHLNLKKFIEKGDKIEIPLPGKNTGNFEGNF
jgi:hypothetical protein